MAGSKLLEVNMKKTQFVIGLSALILLAILLSLPDTPRTYEDVESIIEQQIASCQWRRKIVQLWRDKIDHLT